MRLFLSAVLLFLINSCETRTQPSRPYQIYWQDNNLCVVMKRPTMGIVEIGKIDWNGVVLDEVAEDIFNECIHSKRTGNAVVWVRFENPQTDKYGNVTMIYDDYELATIPFSEAVKYKSSKFLNNEYALTDNIHKAAFGTIGEHNQVNQFHNNIDEEFEEWLTVRNGHINPIDTLDF